MPEQKKDEMIPRSFRIPQSIWEKARARAQREGTSPSAAASDLLEGYARGVYDLPQTRVTKTFPGS